MGGEFNEKKRIKEKRKEKEKWKYINKISLRVSCSLGNFKLKILKLLNGPSNVFITF